jgi:hypothetical protein
LVDDPTFGAKVMVLDIHQFFRRAPKDWLNRYFKAHGVLKGLDWEAVTTRDGDALVRGFLALDADLRDEMMDDFANIRMLSTPAGKVQIIDEAHFHGVHDIVAKRLAELDDIYACAFYARLEHKKCWDGAVFYAAADSKPKRYWRKWINMPRLGRCPTVDDGRALEGALTDVFLNNEARGEYCVVRQLRRGEKGEREYYFAYPQDHKQNTIQYFDGKMTKRPYNPAFEIIFVHNETERTLAIWHQGNMARVKDLQQAFAKAVLKQEIPRDNPHDDRVYDLDRFLRPDFAFHPSPELGIAKIEVRKISIRVLGGASHTVSIDLGTDTDSHVLYRRIEAVTAGIPRTLCKVARVGCRVTFEKRPEDQRNRTRSFEVAWPNSCSLQNDAHGILIQRLLTDHGIEPKRTSVGSADGD